MIILQSIFIAFLVFCVFLMVCVLLFVAYYYLEWWVNVRRWQAKPKMTPQELWQVKLYVARQDYKKLVQEQVNQPPPPTPNQMELKQQLQRERQQRAWDEVKRRQAEQKAAQEAEERRKAQEQAAIDTDFPGWLVEFAEQRNIGRTYANIQALQFWIKFVLEFGQRELAGLISVRLLYAALCGSEQAPLDHVTSWKFFYNLLQVLTQEGLLVTDPATKARRITNDALKRLFEPANGVARCALHAPSLKNQQKPENGEGV